MRGKDGHGTKEKVREIQREIFFLSRIDRKIGRKNKKIEILILKSHFTQILTIKMIARF